MGIETNELYYYRARYYDPSMQMFISKDPIEFEAGDFNFYRYVGNDPVNYVDPWGLTPSSTYPQHLLVTPPNHSQLDSRVDAMINRRERAIEAGRGLPPITRKEALERVKNQQENSDTLCMAIGSLAFGGVVGTGAKAGYGLLMRNPVKTFEFVDAALTALPTVKHISTAAGRAGQAAGWIMRAF